MAVEKPCFAIPILWIVGAFAMAIGCDPGWTQFHDRCYFILNKRGDIQGGFVEARKMCRDLGGDIGTIRSHEAQLFVQDLMVDDNNKSTVYNGAFFGISDSLHEGTWRHLDNTDVTYFNWKSGEPNNYNGKENCARILSGLVYRNKPVFYDRIGLWIDVKCHETQSSTCCVLCEKWNKPTEDTPSVMKEGIFGMIENAFLAGHVINTSINTRFDCLMTCKQNRDCLSVNFKKTSSPDENNCELNAISSHEIQNNTEWSDVNNVSADRDYREWDFYEIPHPGF